MLISLSEALETPVSILLNENVVELEPDSLKEIFEKLKVINLQLAQRKVKKREVLKETLNNSLILQGKVHIQ